MTARVTQASAIEALGLYLRPWMRARWFAVAVIGGASLMMIVAVDVTLSRYDDEVRLSRVAQAIAKSAQLPSNKAIAILHFVYNDKGFLKNDQYFVFPQFGPTAVQVLEKGGDCSDKTRLMVALLRQVGIESTPVMLFDDLMRPTHTVVEAEIETGSMDLDPVYDLYFPKSGGGFYGSAELRKDPRVLLDRLELAGMVDAKAGYYHIETSSYSHASTFNWGKNWFTRAVKSVLLSCYGNRLYQLHRPDIIEDPKLLVATGLAAPALTMFAILAVRNGWSGTKASATDGADDSSRTSMLT